MHMRWQVQEARGIRVINDAYNANPLSMAAALQTFKAAPCAGRKWLVLGEMREMGEFSGALHAEIGEAIAGGPWAGFIAVGEKLLPMVEGACARGYPAEAVIRVADADGAVAALQARVKPGDAVLIKASRGVRLERVAQALGAGGEGH
jgi:UDP-N-acetylmuramoyl-tripeptide--D-alanyl-D-alanine ligase